MTLLPEYLNSKKRLTAGVYLTDFIYLVSSLPYSFKGIYYKKNYTCEILAVRDKSTVFIKNIIG